MLLRNYSLRRALRFGGAGMLIGLSVWLMVIASALGSLWGRGESIATIFDSTAFLRGTTIFSLLFGLIGASIGAITASVQGRILLWRGSGVVLLLVSAFLFTWFIFEATPDLFGWIVMAGICAGGGFLGIIMIIDGRRKALENL